MDKIREFFDSFPARENDSWKPGDPWVPVIPRRYKDAKDAYAKLFQDAPPEKYEHEMTLEERNAWDGSQKEKNMKVACAANRKDEKEWLKKISNWYNSVPVVKAKRDKRMKLDIITQDLMGDDFEGYRNQDCIGFHGCWNLQISDEDMDKVKSNELIEELRESIEQYKELVYYLARDEVERVFYKK